MNYATWNGTSIPNITSLEVSKVLIGDRARTADGTLRQDGMQVKRRWMFETSYLTKAQADAIEGHWSDPQGTLWLYEVGTIDAIVDVESVQRVITPFTDNTGTRHKSGCSLVFGIDER